MRRSVSLGLAIFVGGLLAAAPSAAAPLLSITYTVNGGSFNGLATGPVTGGTLVYIPPGGSASTPLTCSGACGSIAALTLTGPTASFTLLSPIQLTKATITAGTSTVRRTLSTTFISVRTAGITASAFALFQLRTCPLAAGSGCFLASLPGEGTTATHYFTIGSEVRTFVPEPGTGLLLAAGIGALGLLGGGGAAARARRTRG